jgi:Family of unknown function (DUF6580)
MLRRRRSVPNIAVAALASSVLFFLLTNLGVWATSGLYPFTMVGLVACYAAALPFFRNMLAGDFLYTLALFGGFATMEYLMPALRQGHGVPVSVA